MIRISIFCEDTAHRMVVGSLIGRIARENDLKVNQDWRSSVKGRSRVLSEYRTFVRNMAGLEEYPNLIVVATDSNCKGYRDRIREFSGIEDRIPVVHAVPDPHVERWLLLDGAAFKAVFKIGCKAPDRKCARDRYKRILFQEIRRAGIKSILPGYEFSERIVEEMDLDRIRDPSFRHFVDTLRGAFRRLLPPSPECAGDGA